jgi:hypothetical protein
MNAAIKNTEAARARVLRVEWASSTPKAIEIRYHDNPDSEATALDTGYPWESRILQEDLAEVA